MADTRKTTRGMFVKVLNYDKYQDLSNYEYNNEGDKKTTRRQQTPNTINKNDKNDKNDKSVKKITLQLNDKDLQDIADYFQADRYPVTLKVAKYYYDKVLDHEASSGKKYKDYKATIRNWVKRDIESSKIKRKENEL